MSPRRTGGDTKGTQRMRIQCAWFWNDLHGTTTATMITIHPAKESARGFCKGEGKDTANVRYESLTQNLGQMDNRYIAWREDATLA